MPVPKKKRITAENVLSMSEPSSFIGAAWGECSPKRKGYRNGTYTRDLATAMGRLEDLRVPRDRAKAKSTSAFIMGTRPIQRSF